LRLTWFLATSIPSLLYTCLNQSTNHYQEPTERLQKIPTFAKTRHEHPSNTSKKIKAANIREKKISKWASYKVFEAPLLRLSL